LDADSEWPRVIARRRGHSIRISLLAAGPRGITDPEARTCRWRIGTDSELKEKPMPAHALALHRGFRHGGGLMHRPSTGSSVLDRLKSKAVRATRQLSRSFSVDEARESAWDAEWKERLVEVGLATGTGFMIGVAQGRFGKDAMKIGPVPWDLPVGAALVVGSLLRGTGKGSMPMRAVGTGLLTAHAMTWGRGGGKWWRAKKNLPPLIEVSGERTVPATGGGALSDEEIASVARRA
jgi:hypothetical protein